MTETPSGDGMKRVRAEAHVPVGGQIYRMTAEILVREDVQLVPAIAYQPDGSATIGLYGNLDRGKAYAVAHQQAPRVGGTDDAPADDEDYEDQPAWWDQ
jgi:hypothetical protein